jgi:hypothetical protein
MGKGVPSSRFKEARRALVSDLAAGVQPEAFEGTSRPRLGRLGDDWRCLFTPIRFQGPFKFVDTSLQPLSIGKGWG